MNLMDAGEFNGLRKI